MGLKKDCYTSVCLDADTKKRVIDYALKKDISASQAMREFIKDGLARAELSDSSSHSESTEAHMFMEDKPRRSHRK